MKETRKAFNRIGFSARTHRTHISFKDLGLLNSCIDMCSKRMNGHTNASSNASSKTPGMNKDAPIFIPQLYSSLLPPPPPQPPPLFLRVPEPRPPPLYSVSDVFSMDAPHSVVHATDGDHALDSLTLKCSDTRFPDAPPHDLLDQPCVDHAPVPANVTDDSFQAGQKVRVIGLSNTAYNGVEGTLGEWDPSKCRWPIISSRKTFCVKPTNIEKVSIDKADLLSSFMRSAERFEYYTEEYNRWVFDKVWEHANAHGDVEDLIATIADDEKQFDNIYQAFVRE